MSAKIKFYTDENVPNIIAKGLRLRGIDILTTPEAGRRGVSDEEHVGFASREGRVIFTQDADFLRLHAKGVRHSGIVYAHQRTPISDIMHGLILIYQLLDAPDMENHVEFL
jgi:uncharacterized protein with PIN domain